MTNPLNLTDIQFTGNDQTNQKLRRLVQDLVAAERAVNTLLNAVATLSETTSQPVTLADVTVSGLTPGQVLTAITASSAAFEFLKLEGLLDVAIETPSAGQVLTFEDNEWVNATLPTPTPPASGENIGFGQDVYAGLLGSALAFRSIQGDGVNIEVTADADTITISFIGNPLQGPQGVQGPPGQDGQDGEDGMMGPPGPAGASGSGPGGGLTYQQAAALVSMRM